MPEEITNAETKPTETAQTATETAEPKPADTPTAEPAQKPVEKAEPAKETVAEPKQEEYTVESYKDLVDSATVEEFELTEENLNSFKEFGAKNHISPDTLKAIASWSLDNVRKQNEQMQKVKEQWQQENAKKYGDNLKNVKTNVGRVLAEMDKSGQFASLLQHVGAEEHPATLEFLSAIGDVLLEKGSINPNATIQGKEMSLEDMYKNNK